MNVMPKKGEENFAVEKDFAFVNNFVKVFQSVKSVRREMSDKNYLELILAPKLYTNVSAQNLIIKEIYLL